MKRYEPESLGDLLRQAIEESMTAPKLDELDSINAWPPVIGADIARRTSRPFMKNGVMTIRVQAAPLRHELNMMRSAIASALNRHTGKETVKELRFTN